MGYLDADKGLQEAKLIPSWNRVAYAFAEIDEQLLEAVEADNAEVSNAETRDARE